MKKDVYDLINELKKQSTISGIEVKKLLKEYPQKMIEELLNNIKQYSIKIKLENKNTLLYKKNENTFEYGGNVLYLLSYNGEDRIYTNTKTLELAIQTLSLKESEKKQLLDLIGLNQEYQFEIKNIQIENPKYLGKFIKCNSFKDATQKLKMFYDNASNIPNQGYDKIDIKIDILTDYMKKENYEIDVRIDIGQNLNDFNPFRDNIKEFILNQINFDNYKEKDALKKAFDLRDLEKTISVIWIDERNSYHKDYLNIKPKFDNSVIIARNNEKEYTPVQILEEYSQKEIVSEKEYMQLLYPKSPFISSNLGENSNQEELLEGIKSEIINVIQALKDNLKNELFQNNTYYELKTYIYGINEIISQIEDDYGYEKFDLKDFKLKDLRKVSYNLKLDIEEYENFGDHILDYKYNELKNMLSLAENLENEFNMLNLNKKEIKDFKVKSNEFNPIGIGE